MDTIDPTRFVFASLFILGMLGIFALALKKFGQKSFLQKSFLQKYGQVGRLTVLETRYIDAKSKLVLVKRDDAEHLLLIGDGKTLVIEKRIRTKVTDENKA